jgi:hypothetical protein
LSEKVDLHVVLPATESIGPFWVDAAARRPPDTPFAELPAVTLSADLVETLRALLGRSGELFGVGLLDTEMAYSRHSSGWSPWSRRKMPDRRKITSDPRNRDPHGRFEPHLRFAAFVRPGDEKDGPAVLRHKSLHLNRIVTVEASGLARWDVHPLDARIEDLVRAGDAGLVDGDTRRPYLILAVPGGDLGAFSSTWSALEEALSVVWAVVSAAGTAYTGAQVIGAIRARLGGARKVIGSHGAEWARRGGRPSDLSAILAARPRSAAEGASLLGCSVAEAEALLWGLGFEPGKDGRWHPVGDSTEELAVLLLARTLLERSSPMSAEELRAHTEASLPSPRSDATRGDHSTKE